MDAKIIKSKLDFSSVLYFVFIALIIAITQGAFKAGFVYLSIFFSILLVIYIYDMPIIKVILYKDGIGVRFIFFTKYIKLSDIKSYKRKKRFLKIKTNGLFYSNIKLRNFHKNSLDEIEEHLNSKTS